jgi:MFS family permease
MLMLTYGVLGGFGLGLIYLPAVVAVGYYFEKKRALATGISVCGSGVGTFIFAPFATYLLDKYGWRGANIIFAALCLQCAVRLTVSPIFAKFIIYLLQVFGALMRPLSMNVLVEEEEEEDECVLKLPDGTIHIQVSIL